MPTVVLMLQNGLLLLQSAHTSLILVGVSGCFDAAFQRIICFDAAFQRDEKSRVVTT